MKKLIALLFIVSLCSFGTQQEKKLKVELSVQQWQAILNQLDESQAPHTEIKVTTGWIISQLQEQIKDSTGKK